TVANYSPTDIPDISRRSINDLWPSGYWEIFSQSTQVKDDKQVVLHEGPLGSRNYHGGMQIMGGKPMVTHLRREWTKPTKKRSIFTQPPGNKLIDLGRLYMVPRQPNIANVGGIISDGGETSAHKEEVVGGVKGHKASKMCPAPRFRNDRSY